MERSQDTLNENIVERFKALSDFGIEVGLEIRYYDDTPAVKDAANPQILTDDGFKVSIGQAWNFNGERIHITEDATYAAGNPLLTDTQVPPVATPQSTGNTGVVGSPSSGIPFAKDAFNVNIDTFVVIKYLQTTDLSVSAAVVPGFPFEYPKLDDGYEIVPLGSAADVSTALAEGGQFLGFIQASDGLVSDIWPVGSGSPTFQREIFQVDIVTHTADPDAHHNKAHSHTTADGSAETDGDGDVTIGSGEEVKVGDENYRDNLSYMFGPGITLDPEVITDQNALLPFNDILNVVETQVGFPDLLRLRDLRDGERIFVNGRVKKSITGTDSGIVDGSLTVYEIAVPSTGTEHLFWLLIDEDGALEVEDLGATPVTEPEFPRDKFVVGVFPAQSGNVTGGPASFTDRRFFGVVGDKSFQSNSLKEVASYFTFTEAVQSTGVALWTKYSIDASLLTSTDTFQSIKIFDLPARGVIEGVILKHSSPFTGGSLTRVTAEVGFDAGSDPAESARHAAPFDIYQTPGEFVSRATDQISPESFDNITGIWVTFRAYEGTPPIESGSINVAASSGGALDIWVRASLVPA
jgi:hypothetical protein